MKRQFSCELYAPSLKKNLRFNELPLKYLKNIIKYIENRDNTGLCEYFTELLDSLCVDGDTSDLDRIDKFCILLALRIISVGPTIEMKFKCKSTGNEFNYKLDLFKILQTIADMDTLYDDKTVIIDKNISIELGFPAKLSYELNDEVIFECLSRVNIKDKTFNIKALHGPERENILSLLPSSISKDIINFVIEKQKMLNSIIFLDVKSPFDPDSDVITLHFDGINDAILEFIKAVYKMNINEIYELVYFLTTKLKFSGDYIENSLTFAESIIYLNKFKKEMEDRQKEYKKQQMGAQSSSSGMPLPLQVPYGGLE